MYIIREQNTLTLRGFHYLFLPKTTLLYSCEEGAKTLTAGARRKIDILS